MMTTSCIKTWVRDESRREVSSQEAERLGLFTLVLVKGISIAQPPRGLTSTNTHSGCAGMFREVGLH